MGPIKLPWRRRSLLFWGSASALAIASLHVYAQQSPDIAWTRVTGANFVSPVAVSPDGTFVASAGASNSVRLSMLSDGAVIRDLLGHSNAVDSVAFSPDGAMLASCSEDRTLRLWDVASGTLLRTIPQGGGNRQFVAVTFHPNGQYVAADRNRTNVALWKVSDGTLVWEALGNRSEIHSIAFSPDGKIAAASGGYRGLDVSIRLIRVLDGQPLGSLITSNTYAVERLAFSPDGNYLAAGTYESTGFAGAVEVWRVDDWTRILRLPVQAPVLAFSPDSQLLITAHSRSLEMWRIPQGRLLKTFALPTNEPAFSRHESLAISPRADRIVTGRYRFISTVNGTIPEGSMSAIQFPVVLSISKDASQMTLRWTGGYSLYLVQRRAVENGFWHNVGNPTIEHGLTVPIEQSGSLFRVIAH